MSNHKTKSHHHLVVDGLMIYEDVRRRSYLLHLQALIILLLKVIQAQESF